MLIIDIVFYTLTIFLYFICMNQLSDILFSDLIYQEKQKKRFTFFVTGGLLAIGVSHFMNSEGVGLRNKYLVNGLSIGGKLLILNAIIPELQVHSALLIYLHLN